MQKIITTHLRKEAEGKTVGKPIKITRKLYRHLKNSVKAFTEAEKLSLLRRLKLNKKNKLTLK